MNHQTKPLHPHSSIKPEETFVVGYGKIVVWTLLFQLAWSWKTLKNIIVEGALQGPDDFLRLNQVRTLLSGQDWFDSTVYRMLLPQGADIHWSRLIDAPIASLIFLLEPVLGQELAERITSILWPTLILVLTVLVITRICDELFPSYNRLLPLFFTVLCVSSLAEFIPGRIDHHNVQILLYVGSLWCLVNWQKPIANIIAGIIVPLSVSIGLDVLVFFVIFMAWFGIEWAFGSDRYGKALQRFAVSLGLASVILYPINIAPSQWLIAYCDANSLVYLTTFLLIGFSMSAMSNFSLLLNFRNTTVRGFSRLALAGFLALASAILLFSLFPQCLAGPYGAVSDELNARWLSQVVEAKSLTQVLTEFPENWIKTIAYCLMILTLGAWSIAKQNRNKGALLIIYAAFLVAVLLAFIQFRTIRIGFFAAIPICVLISEILTKALTNRFGRGAWQSKIGQVAGVIFLSTASWALIGTLLLAKPTASAKINDSQDSRQTNEQSQVFRRTCFHESDYAKLARLPKGHVMSDLNSGPAVLIFTDKTVVVGPYHRNQQGILDVLDFYLTDPVRAEAISERHGLDYVVLCRTSGQSASKPRKGNTLRSHLYSGDIPAWLEQISTPEDKLMVFRVKK